MTSMETVNNLPPQITPKDSSAILSKPIAAAAQETKTIANLGQESVPAPAETGKKIDLKV